MYKPMTINTNTTTKPDIINKAQLKIKDPGSALTHFIGILYSALLTPVIFMHAFEKGTDQITIISIEVFMISMILLYSASTIYHTFDLSEHTNKILKKFDHCMIFILIAGTYTPVCLTALRSTIGPKLLLFVWGFAIAGILFKLCWVTCPKWVSSVIYIGMGWSCIFAIPTLFHVLSLPCFLWLLIGGIVYTVGGVIYALKLNAFNDRFPNFGSHEIFHVFVMVGNLCQFVCIMMMM